MLLSPFSHLSRPEVEGDAQLIDVRRWVEVRVQEDNMLQKGQRQRNVPRRAIVFIPRRSFKCTIWIECSSSFSVWTPKKLQWREATTCTIRHATLTECKSVPSTDTCGETCSTRRRHCSWIPTSYGECGDTLKRHLSRNSSTHILPLASLNLVIQ